MRLLLFLLISFVGLTATICGMLLIADPDGSVFQLSHSMLQGTFFKNFLIPGIILTIVGSINMAAVFSNMQGSKNRYNWSLAGGILICVWIILQIIMIQTFYWLQFVYLGTGILVILLSFQLKGKWIV